MEEVADAFNTEGREVRAHYIPESCREDVVSYVKNELGIVEPSSDGVHDFYWFTVQ